MSRSIRSSSPTSVATIRRTSSSGKNGPISPKGKPIVFWLVDPIDGTRSLLRGHGGYAAMISLVIEGDPQLTLVHDVKKQETVVARKSSGVWLVSGSSKQEMPRPSRPDRCLLWNAFAAETLKHRLMSCLGLSAVLETESLGLRAVQMARGRGTVLLSAKPFPRIWDTAPASVIISAIGGNYTDLHGRPLLYSPHHLEHDDGAVGTFGMDHQDVLHCLSA